MKLNSSFNIIVICLLLTSSVFAKGDIEDRIETLNWDGTEVVWLHDDRFPTYTISIYFGDGALGDSRNHSGETQAMFDMLTAGTRRFKQSEIVENLEFYGVSYGANVTHEYSTFTVSGLVKDIVPTMKKICHLFADATFPKKELKKEKRRYSDSLKNLVGSHGALASRAFREISLGGTPYTLPASGKLKDLKNITQQKLKAKLSYFNKKVAKRIYLAGPKQVTLAESILAKECGWSTSKDGGFNRRANYSPKKILSQPEIYLVTVPKANQAQVRMGRFLNRDEYKNEELLDLASEFLGGGFTSRLMREIRVKRGLSYSASAYAGGQREYGRAGISTFTKNEKIGELLQVIKGTLNDVGQDSKIDRGDFLRAQGSLAGSYPFRFEKTPAFLGQLMMLDHRGKDYSELKKFKDRVTSLKKEQVAMELNRVFGWNKQTIVIVGTKSLLKSLKKFGKVKVLSYKDFL